MNSRKPRGPSGRGSHAVGHQSFRFVFLYSFNCNQLMILMFYLLYRQQQQHPNKNVQRPSLEKSSSEEKSLDSPGEQINGMYLNIRIVHAMSSLVGTVVQITDKDGITYEGVLRTFSDQCEIALDAMSVVVDPRSASDGNNIGHLISSLAAKQPLVERKLFKLDEVVSLCVPNTDMDYASRGAFATDAELSRGKKVDDEKRLVPWTPGPEDLPEDKQSHLESTSSSNGWSAEEMFARNEKLGVTSGFSDLDGTYTIALQSDDTPEAREKKRQAEALAREIEDNLTSRRRAEKENSDERTEEEQFSSVIRQQDSSFRQQHPKHVPGGNNRSSAEDTNWRSHGNRQQNTGPKPASVFSNKGNFNANNSPRDQRQQQDQRQHSREERRGDGKRQPPLLQQQMPQQHQQLQQHPSVHRPPPPSLQQQQQTPSVVKEDVAPKSVAPSITSSAPNYARAVTAQPVVEDSRHNNAWTGGTPASLSRRRDESEVTQQTKMPSPESSDKKEATPVTTKSSPERTSPQTPNKSQDNRKQEDNKNKTDSETNKKQSSPETDSTSSLESIAKTSKLNPNAKEFTLNPKAAPFTPRATVVNNPVVTPTTVFSPQAVIPAAMQSMQGMHPHQQQQQPHHHQQQQHPPQMIHMPQGMARMPNHQQVLLPQNFSPGNTIIFPNNNPYQVVMGPQFQQPVQVSQHNPRPGGHKSNYKGQNPNRSDQFNQSNVAAATGHPVLATAPNAYLQQPGLNGAQIFPVYSMPGFTPRMPNQFIQHQVNPYDPSVYSECRHMLELCFMN